MKTFSIITCTYNASATVKRTLESIAKQDYQDKELIIVDGASQDGTLEIVRQYEGLVTKLISERDKGLYDAMNKGITAASGDYLIFLNAGDKFHSDTTLSEVAALIKGDEDVIYGETAWVDDNGEFQRMRRLKAPDKLNWRSFTKGMLVCHQAFWARRDLALRNPYNLKYRYSADVDWCIRIMKESKNLFNSRKVLIDYLSEGMSTANRKASLKERFAIMRDHYGLPCTMANHLWFLVRAVVKR